MKFRIGLAKNIHPISSKKLQTAINQKIEKLKNGLSLTLLKEIMTS
jgi:hypothetical protein